MSAGGGAINHPVVGVVVAYQMRPAAEVQDRAAAHQSLGPGLAALLVDGFADPAHDAVRGPGVTRLHSGQNGRETDERRAPEERAAFLHVGVVGDAVGDPYRVDDCLPYPAISCLSVAARRP